MSDRVMVDQVYGAVVHARVLIMLALLLGPLWACSKADAACGKPFAEPIDPNSSQHLLPGSPELPYTTDPPTSGAHRPGEVPTGLVLKQLDRATQVNALEAGRVIIQYRKLNAIGFAAVGKLAGDNVVVAPNRDLKSPIVATAWLFKMECSKVDGDALQSFIDAHAENHESD